MDEGFDGGELVGGDVHVVGDGDFHDEHEACAEVQAVEVVGGQIPIGVVVGFGSACDDVVVGGFVVSDARGEFVDGHVALVFEGLAFVGGDVGEGFGGVVAQLLFEEFVGFLFVVVFGHVVRCFGDSFACGCLRP